MAGIDRGEVCEPTGSRVRAVLGGVTVADSRATVLWRCGSADLTYGFPSHDVRGDCLVPAPTAAGESAFAPRFHLVAGDRRATAAVGYVPAGALGLGVDGGYYFIGFDAVDAWYEEDERLVCHARDPYTRVDVRSSSRHLRIELDGESIAETRQPLLLFETGLPVRYYIPWADVRTQYLAPSDTETVCCYKGRARYWHIRTGSGEHRDMAWDYPEPLDDAARVREAVCFYQTALSLYLDGALEHRAPRFFAAR